MRFSRNYPFDWASRAVPFLESRFHAGDLAGQEAVPAVEDIAVEHNDGVPKPVFPDVVGKFLEFILAELRKKHARGVVGVLCGLLVAAVVRL